MSGPNKDQWYTVADVGPPPFDTQVLVYGQREIIDGLRNSHGFVPCYALAFNNCYRPDMCMSQTLELNEAHRKLLPVYIEVPFEITHWIVLGAPDDKTS